MMASTIARFNKGEPVLYYSWVPYWVGAVMKPGKDVVWMEVPFSSLPGEGGNEINTKLPDGSNYGFRVNTQCIVANKTFTDDNPAAKALFQAMNLSGEHISAQNLAMRNGQNTDEDIARHTDQWIKANQGIYNRWLKTARAATQ